MIRCFFVALALLVLSCGCNVVKYLPNGEQLYGGSTVHVKKQDSMKVTEKQMAQQLRQWVRPVKNTFFFNQPYKVWWWYVIGEPKRHPRGFRAFARRVLGEPPVLSSQVNVAITAKNMQAYLENIGYFHSSVSADTTIHGYFTNAAYRVNLLPQYTIRNIEWIGDSTGLRNLLTNGNDTTNTVLNSGLLQKGKPFRVADLKAEIDRLDLLLKTKGYYYFSPDYILLYADSTVGNNQVDLFVGIKPNTPAAALKQYTINSITVLPSYNLLQPTEGSRNIDTTADGLIIQDTAGRFKNRLFRQMITYRTGAMYSSFDHNTTLNRLINLGAFKFVKNTFETEKDPAKPQQLNVRYYLTAAKHKSLQASLDGFSKESKYLGIQASGNWKNRNVFGGGEQLNVKLYSSFELSFNDSSRANNNFHTGTEISLNFPGYRLPFITIAEKQLFPVRTQFLFGYEYFNRHQFYSKNIFRFSYEFQRKTNPNKQQVFAPFNFTHIHALNVRDSFNKAVTIVPAIAANLYDETIISSYYTYTFNTLNPLAGNQWFFTAGVEAAGTLAGLIAQPAKVRAATILGTPFSQYIKFDADVRYTRKFRNELKWANRFQLGIGIPYGNAAMLPFSKQYVVGGGGSMRAFSVRNMGPGSFLPNAKDQSYYQLIGGDFKLLINSELRIPVIERVEAAVFVDIGNTWTKDTLLFGRAGQLKKDWYKELAVAAGVGIRINASLVLLRLDVGVPLRTPYLPENQRWLLSEVNFGSGTWRRSNLVFNLALGYPF